jgi:hypothetical protein
MSDLQCASLEWGYAIRSASDPDVVTALGYMSTGTYLDLETNLIAMTGKGLNVAVAMALYIKSLETRIIELERRLGEE